MQAKWLWPLVVREGIYQEILNPKTGNKASLSWWIQSIFEGPKIRKVGLWFWPSICETKTWAQGDIGEYRDPSGFRDYSDDIEILCDTVVHHTSAAGVPVLDLGCNAGRHLNLLLSKGLTNLYGVDICKRAIELSEEWFPNTKGKVKFSHDLFQRYLPTIEDRFFEIVYTHATTIEATHPSFDIVKQIARVTAKHAILLIQEHDAYTRFWEYEFRRQGFVLTFVKRPILFEYIDTTTSVYASPNTLFVYTRTDTLIEPPWYKG